jgi:hypothetical protein
MKSGKGADGSGGRGKKKNPKAKAPEGLRARDVAAKKFDVGGKTVDHAAKVLKQGSKELVRRRGKSNGFCSHSLRHD